MIRKLLWLGLVMALVIGMIAVPARAATEEEIEDAVEKGVAWLVEQQNADGSWGDPANAVAYTGFAVVKLEDRAFELGMSPFDPEYPYTENVTTGLDYIFSRALTNDCGTYFEWGTYTTGIAMMAIAAGRDMDRVVEVPGGIVDGMTYAQVLEANVEYFANSQVSSGQWLGGWLYQCGEEMADNSNSGYAVLGLRYAEAAGTEIPQSLKDNLDVWIDYIQNDVDGDPLDGGSGYVYPDDWVNLLKTGNLLFQMDFVGDNLETQRVQDAIDYIERHWNDADWDPGWKGPGFGGEDRPHMQAAYCLMKGLESFNIQSLEVGGSDIDWFDEMSTAIINAQLGDGSWPYDYWGDELLGTEWALLTLERVVPPLEVLIDIKPGSFPNSINLGSKGVIPVAILTTSVGAGDPQDFDATTVDPATVVFAGAQPLRWAFEDVDYDGDIDMILHFATQEVEIAPGDTDATLIGMTFDGRDIVGTDSVRTVPPKGKK